MLTHRCGTTVLVCDGCFTVWDGSPGWQVELGLLDARPARAMKNKPTDATPPMVLQVRQDAHACPACATPYGRPLHHASTVAQ